MFACCRSSDAKEDHTGGTGDGTKVAQQWTIFISSANTGATDREDDGRRLRLTLFDEAGARLYVGSTDSGAPEPDGWQEPKYSKDSWERTGVVTVEAPVGARPAVLKLEKIDDAEAELQPGYKGATDYIDSVTVTCTGANKFSTQFVAERWVASTKACLTPDYAGITLFASTTLPQHATPFLRDMRGLELAKLRGEAYEGADPAFGLKFAGLTKEQRDAPRKVPGPPGTKGMIEPYVTFYDYQTYNDLGKDGAPRPTLGGNPDYPYPRRLATDLGTEGGTESNSDQPWLPMDEEFSFTKQTDFNSGLLAAAVPAVFTGIKHMADELLTGSFLHTLAQADKDQVSGGLPQKLLALAAKDSFDSFREVESHYSNNALRDPLDPKQGTVQPVKGKPATVITEAGAKQQQQDDDTKPEGLDEKLRGMFGLGELHKRFEESILGPHNAAKAAAGAAKVGVGKLLQFAGDVLRGDLLDDMKKPRVLVNRPDGVVFEDFEFGRQMLAGFNPSTIAALHQMPEQLGSAITEEDVAGDLGAYGVTMEGLVKAAAAGDKPRLFLVDYWKPYASLFVEPWDEPEKVLHAGRAIFFLKQDQKTGKDVSLEPIVIELAAHPSAYGQPLPDAANIPTSGTVYSRSQLRESGAEEVWELAKLVFKALDVGVHQLISHWLRCHAAIEPFLIALRRQISTAHPVYLLLFPHFRYTMNINAAARGNLINAGGIIERTFAPGGYAMRLSATVYKNAWRFEDQALPQDLRKRGMVDAAGKPFLSYPYAEDGLAIWRAMEAYFGDYLALYYGSGAEGDSKVAADEELQAFWKDVTTKAHPDIKDESHWGLQDASRISTSAELVRILVTIAWTASAHHAAVNFGQYDYTSFPLNAPSLIRKAMPRSKDDADWKALIKSRGKGREYENEVLSYINSPVTNLIVAATVNVLSTHSQDEHLLDEGNTLLTDPAAQALNSTFIKNMKSLETSIIAVHTKGSEWTRCRPSSKVKTPQASWATTLIPGSAPGLTLRGVPYSVSI